MSEFGAHVLHDVIVALFTLALVLFAVALKGAISIKVEDSGEVRPIERRRPL